MRKIHNAAELVAQLVSNDQLALICRDAVADYARELNRLIRRVQQHADTTEDYKRLQKKMQDVLDRLMRACGYGPDGTTLNGARYS